MSFFLFHFVYFLVGWHHNKVSASALHTHIVSTTANQHFQILHCTLSLARVAMLHLIVFSTQLFLLSTYIFCMRSSILGHNFRFWISRNFQIENNLVFSIPNTWLFVWLFCAVFSLQMHINIHMVLLLPLYFCLAVSFSSDFWTASKSHLNAVNQRRS